MANPIFVAEEATISGSADLCAANQTLDPAGSAERDGYNIIESFVGNFC